MEGAVQKGAPYCEPVSGDRTPDERADALAAAQHSAISRRQALDVGLTRNQIDGRLARRRWLRRVRGVFVVAAAAETWQQRVTVACLANPGTVASHLTAAALLGLADPPEVPHVTVQAKASNRVPGAVAHRTRRPLDSRDLSCVGGVPTTSAARTLVDCAAVLDDRFLRAPRRRPHPPAHHPSGRSGRRRPSVQRPRPQGPPLIDQALEVWSTGRRPDSPPEMKLERLILKWGLPAPVRQHPVFDERGRFVAKVDLALLPWKVALEYDGQEFHGPRRKTADATRQARLEALGWRVLRVTKYDLRRPAHLRSRLQAFVDGCAA